MAFQIKITRDAETHLNFLPIRDRRTLETAIVDRLVHQPTALSKSIKKLRPNPLAEYELRVGDLRALYNVEATEVALLVIGRKVGNTLVVNGEVFHGHQDNPAEPL